MKMRMLLLIAVLLAVWTGCALAEQVVTPGEAIVPPQATLQPEHTPEPTAQPENKPEPTQQPVGTPVPSVQPEPTQAPAQGRAAIGNMETIEIERKKTMTLAVPVEFGAGGESWYSNMLGSGSIVQYDPTRSAIGYSGDIFSALSSLSVEIDQEGDLPFYRQTLGGRKYIVSMLNDSTAQQLGFTKVQRSGKTVYVDPLNGAAYEEGARYNAGFAVFEGLIVHTSVRNGVYEIPVKIRWESEQYGSGSAKAVLQATAVNSDVPATTTGGGGGGGYYYYGGNDEAGPEAKLIVQSVSTSPENPVAGDEFDVILKLYNTSQTEAVGNIVINCEAESDAVLPVSGAFSAYIDTIGANRAVEQRLRVRAQTDIEDEPVKIYVMIDYEDANAGAHSVSQTVVIRVSQLMRIKLDDPVLPSDGSVAGESYPISMGVFNLGRTTLYNVTVTPRSEDTGLSVGAAFYCGNMESGTSKTAEIRLTPMQEGSHSAQLVVSYENGRGESFSEVKNVSFYSESYEEEDWFAGFEMDEPEPTPEPGPARMAMEVAAVLPWWAYAFVGCVFMLVVVSIGVSARHRRIRAFENDEMD